MLTQIGNSKFLAKIDLNKDSIRSHFGKNISARHIWIDSGGPLHSMGRGKCEDQPSTRETEKYADSLLDN